MIKLLIKNSLNFRVLFCEKNLFCSLVFNFGFEEVTIFQVQQSHESIYFPCFLFIKTCYLHTSKGRKLQKV